MQKCILKIILDNDLYDEMTDSLLTFPLRELEFMGFSVQAHTRSLEDISEQVSGFKQVSGGSGQKIRRSEEY